MKTMHNIPENLFYQIPLSKAVSKFARELKNRVSEILGDNYEDRYSVPHLSLVKDNDPRAERSLYYVEMMAYNLFKPFDVSVKGLGYFYQWNGRYTIYLDIVHKSPIDDVLRTLAESDVNFVPHITIAKNLEYKDFQKVWNAVKDVDYSNYYLCDHLLVLKRAHNRWTEHCKIPLGGIYTGK